VVRIPIAGLCIFGILYVVAIYYYPGGSESNRLSKKFSWLHNYWCDLLKSTAENGLANTAKPFAIAAMVVLCLSLMIFWSLVPRWLPVQRWVKQVIRLTGMASMLMLILLNTNRHDLVINVSLLFGLAAMVLTLYGLNKRRMFFLLITGYICIVLCLLNTYIYYSQNGINTLPLIQKLSFLIFLLWFSLVLWWLPNSRYR
jgi:hypothetical protein